MKLKNFFGHLKTIRKHRRLVRKFCFRCGLYSQGLRHDLSKYAPCEFFAGVRFFQGDRSPNDMERRENGYSAAWLHHKGRNRHHWEYWQDYVPKQGLRYVEMPEKYLYEMACDRIAACRVYHKSAYSSKDALAYFDNSTAKNIMNEKTAEKLRSLLVVCADEGEEAMFSLIRSRVKGK